MLAEKTPSSGMKLINLTLLAEKTPSSGMIFKIHETINPLRFAPCSMPYALCPMPYAFWHNSCIIKKYHIILAPHVKATHPYQGQSTLWHYPDSQGRYPESRKMTLTILIQ